MIIDKNGKLFGKISIIDIIVVVLIAVAAGVVGLRFLSGQNTGILSSSGADRLEITFYSEEVNDFVVDAISIGDSTMEYAQYASFGTVIDVMPGPSVTWVPDADGVVHQGHKEGKYYSLTVKTEAFGTIDNTGFTLDGTKYFVGKTVIMYVGKAGYQGRISSVKKVN
jgi:hypothetical protein